MKLSVKIILLSCLAFFLLIASLPSLIISPWVRYLLQNQLEEYPRFKVEIENLSWGWFSPFKASNILIDDTETQTTYQIIQAEYPGSLIEFFKSNSFFEFFVRGEILYSDKSKGSFFLSSNCCNFEQIRSQFLLSKKELLDLNFHVENAPIEIFETFSEEKTPLTALLGKRFTASLKTTPSETESVFFFYFESDTSRLSTALKQEGSRFISTEPLEMDIDINQKALSHLSPGVKINLKKPLEIHVRSKEFNIDLSEEKLLSPSFKGKIYSSLLALNYGENSIDSKGFFIESSLEKGALEADGAFTFTLNGKEEGKVSFSSDGKETHFEAFLPTTFLASTESSEPIDIKGNLLKEGSSYKVNLALSSGNLSISPFSLEWRNKIQLINPINIQWREPQQGFTFNLTLKKLSLFPSPDLQTLFDSIQTEGRSEWVFQDPEGSTLIRSETLLSKEKKSPLTSSFKVNYTLFSSLFEKNRLPVALEGRWSLAMQNSDLYLETPPIDVIVQQNSFLLTTEKPRYKLSALNENPLRFFLKKESEALLEVTVTNQPEISIEILSKTTKAHISHENIEILGKNLVIEPVLLTLLVKKDPPFKLFYEMGQQPADFKITSKDNLFTMDFKNSLTSITLEGAHEQNFFYLKKPFTGSFKITQKISETFLQYLIPFLKSAEGSNAPLEIFIEESGSKIALPPETLTKSLLKGILYPHTIYFRPDGELNDLLALIDLKKSLYKENVVIEFMPLYFSLDKGLLYIHRTDFLLENSYPLALWGTIDFNQEKLALYLGLGAQLLEKAFGIKGLPSTYMMPIRIEGSIYSPRINKASTSAKIGALAAALHGSPEGQLIGGVLEVFAGSFKDGPVPPPTTPPPWITQEKESSLPTPMNILKEGSRNILKIIDKL